jgi:hypothetical protein
MSLVAWLARYFLSRRRPAVRPTLPIDPDRLQRIYRETHRQMEDLRRAA